MIESGQNFSNAVYMDDESKNIKIYTSTIRLFLYRDESVFLVN